MHDGKSGPLLKPKINQTLLLIGIRVSLNQVELLVGPRHVILGGQLDDLVLDLLFIWVDDQQGLSLNRGQLWHAVNHIQDGVLGELLQSDELG